MAKTGVKDSWKGQVITYLVDSNDIKNLEDLEFSQTDLKPFVNFNKFIEEFNNSLSNYKNYVKLNSDHMYNVAENKLFDDQTEASLILKGPMCYGTKS